MFNDYYKTVKTMEKDKYNKNISMYNNLYAYH